MYSILYIYNNFFLDFMEINACAQFGKLFQLAVLFAAVASSTIVATIATTLLLLML